MNAQGRKSDKPEKVRVCTFSLSKKARKEEENHVLGKINQKWQILLKYLMLAFHVYIKMQNHQKIHV